jgi:hypothetical protein
MEKTGKAVAWTCILGTLCMGCYSSALIKPTAAEKERIYTDRIDYVVTKDGKEHVFHGAPVVANDTIVGCEAVSIVHASWVLEQVSIPLSDVAQVSVSRVNARKTMTWACVVGATIAVTYAILANNPIGPGTALHLQ